MKQPRIQPCIRRCDEPLASISDPASDRQQFFARFLTRFWRTLSPLLHRTLLCVRSGADLLDLFVTSATPS